MPLRGVEGASQAIWKPCTAWYRVSVFVAPGGGFGGPRRSGVEVCLVQRLGRQTGSSECVGGLMS